MITEHALLPVTAGREREFEDSMREALPIIESAPGCHGAEVRAQVEDPSLPAPGLVARVSDGSVALRATMDLVEERLLDRRRGELAKACCAEALAL